MSAPVDCADDRRRATARRGGRNGVDGIDVADDQRTLTVSFFADPPADLGPENFRIDGGRRVTGIRVTAVAAGPDSGPDRAGRVRLTVDRPGDHSTYRLRVVEPGPHGRPGTRPHRRFDPRYDSLEFSFKQNCANLLDCAPAGDCPPRDRPGPEIDYLARDYPSFRHLLLDRMSLTMPAWTERHSADLGIALVELLAYLGDRLSYRQDAVATEAYLDTARRRVSVRRHARLVDYPMHDGCAARAWVCLDTAARITLTAGDFRFASLPPEIPTTGGPALLAEDLRRPGVPPHEVFEPVHHEDVTLHPEHNRIRLWTWGGHRCCLPVGATAATLVDGPPGPGPAPDPGTGAAVDAAGAAQPGPDGDPDGTRVLKLKPGDVLVFAEVRDARTGAAADADHSHRQAVRLTSVTPAVDTLYRQPVLEVTWAREDALGFPLCVNARGGPDCADLEVGVAYGNVVLVDHGRSLTWCGAPAETHHPAPAPRPDGPGCPAPPEFGCPDPLGPAHGAADPAGPPGPGPALRHGPVTQRVPFPSPGDVARAQARQLAGIPERARERLNTMWRALQRGDGLTTGDEAYLTVLFGAATLAGVGLPDHPGRAVRALSARFDVLLAGKLSRLRDLVRRARAGYLLSTGADGWEITHTWGDREGAATDPAAPAARGPAGPALRPDPRAALPAVTVAVEGTDGPPWLPRRDLLDSGPTDRHVVGEVDDDGVLTLRFGDGRSGARPPAGSSIRVRYRVGNGRAGNVGRDAINRIVFCATRQAAIRRVWNPLPASGGVDPEPVAEVRQRAPQDVRYRLLRAVTAADYEALAGQVPGVQRAAAELRWVGGWYEVRVAVDPAGDDIAPGWLLDSVREALHPYRRIGHDLAVVSAVLVPLDVALTVRVEPDHVAGQVRAALLRVLGAGRRPDGRLGFFHPDNLSFGTPIRVSALVAAAAAVPGVRQVEVTRLRPLFGPAGNALDEGALRMRPLEVPQLDNDPARPENGLLTLVLEGGR